MKKYRGLPVGWNSGGWLIWILRIVILLFIAIMMLPLAEHVKSLIVDLGFILISPIPIYMAHRASTHQALHMRTQRAWHMISVAFLALWVGNGLWLYYDTVVGTKSFPSWAEAAYLAFYPPALYGFLLLTSPPRSRDEKIKFWLDATIVIMGGAMVLGHQVFWPIIHTRAHDLLTVALALFFPMGDLLALFLVVVALLRRPRAERYPLGLLAAGVAFYTGASVGYGYLYLMNTYRGGGWVDLGWLLFYYGVAASAFHHYSETSDKAVLETHDVPYQHSLLPYGAIVIGYTVVILGTNSVEGYGWSNRTISVVVLMALVAIRQAAAVRENEHLRIERAVSRGSERLHALVQNTSDVITVINKDGLIQYITPSVYRILGYRPEELLGTHILALVYPDKTFKHRTLADRFMTQTGVTRPFRCRVACKDGSWLYMETIGNNLLEDPNVGGIVLTTRDVTDREVLEKHLSYQAFHDSTTGLFNRAFFHSRIEKSTNSERAVLYLDLDDFKNINDTLGHAFGDDLLQAVASVLRGCVRKQDTVARLGGDEFAILLEYASVTQKATEVAERILAAMATPLRVHNHPIKMRVSMGIAIDEQGEVSAERLIQYADTAMYAAKKSGKNCYRFYTPEMHISLYGTSGAMS